ncbi:MAG: DUF1801 domain-containing protein [Ilumatobacteraceae bacterium]
MVSSAAVTVDEYLNGLSPERAQVVRTVRDTVARNLPAGYAETMRWGMISYEIPLERYPNTYNGQPLGVLALAAQARHYALYLNAADTSPELMDRLREAYAAAGIKFDMGKSCLRFRNLAGIDLDAIGEIVASVSPDRYIELYEASRPAP